MDSRRKSCPELTLCFLLLTDHLLPSSPMQSRSWAPSTLRGLLPQIGREMPLMMATASDLISSKDVAVAQLQRP
ncbi:uncharacterized protein BDW70DRAFT_126859 [Aspergillus foveolatus]|uniref:uncharacterized protein n=1 Tax=Aspergillus foveolatus TaxID=210207 RepID=UPI003CCDA827